MFYTSKLQILVSGHATAEDMLSHFSSSILDSGLPVQNMIQISMDGPNVNWKFFDLIKEKISLEYGTSVISIGSCGLHVVHNCFKTGCTATDWKPQVSSVLSSLYYLFKDTPARREDYITQTGSQLLPLKFVSHRWLENVPVCERAIQIWPAVKLYVAAVEEKKVSNPKTKSYDVVKEAVGDKLMLPKIHFFKCIASQMEPFLSMYQAEQPMVPFLASDLSHLIRSLMRRFIKSSVLDEATTTEKLIRVDVAKTENHATHKKIDVGFGAEKELKEAKISDRDRLQFRMECKEFLVAALKKLLLKSPIVYSLVRHMSALDPRKMESSPDACRSNFKKIVSILSQHGRVHETECDIVWQQYSQFLDNIPIIGTEKFQKFSPKSDRVDELLCPFMASDEYILLLKVIKMLLILSHGQAAVERGFSVNKEVEVENLKDSSIVAQRLVCDTVRSYGGILNVPITNGLQMSVASSRSKYEAYLDQERKKKETQQIQSKRKQAMDEVEGLKHTQKRLKADIEALTKSANQLAEKAESTGNLTFIAQSNAHRRAATSKAKELDAKEKELDDKLSDLKKI